VLTAHSSSADTATAVRDVAGALAVDGEPACIVFMAAIGQDGADIARGLRARFPSACVIGCSTNGEFTERARSRGGLAAMALSRSKVASCAATIAHVGGDVEEGVRAAAARLSAAVGQDIRELDPQRWVGLALLEGAKGREERINEALGNVAPCLSFVGGSAGDDVQFKQTWVAADGAFDPDGCALLLMELRVPFAVLKTCSFEPTSRAVTVTRADPSRRRILELDGRPAAPYYAELTGVRPEDLTLAHCSQTPLGLMIDGEPWLRSIIRAEGDALLCACSVLPGTTLSLMRATDMVDDAARAIAAREQHELHAPVAGAILFNCIARQAEASVKGIEEPYHAALSRVVHVGMHTNGESWLGHINQTLTGLLIA
jgi:hypothetical protein